MPSIHNEPPTGSRPQDRLVRIAQRYKRERNQARLERDEAHQRYEEAQRNRIELGEEPVSASTYTALQ
jgi:hypothetical protein